MKATIIRPCEVNVRLLVAYLGDIEYAMFGSEFVDDDSGIKTIEDLYRKCPNIECTCDGQNSIKLCINVDTGEVENWPKNVPMQFYDVKIVDTGKYELYDDKDNLIEFYHGYVPDCLGRGGYGDYLEFEIDENGYIVDWDFTEDDVKKFFEED